MEVKLLQLGMEEYLNVRCNDEINGAIRRLKRGNFPGIDEVAVINLKRWGMFAGIDIFTIKRLSHGLVQGVNTLLKMDGAVVVGHDS